MNFFGKTIDRTKRGPQRVTARFGRHFRERSQPSSVLSSESKAWRTRFPPAGLSYLSLWCVSADGIGGVCAIPRVPSPGHTLWLLRGHRLPAAPLLPGAEASSQLACCAIVLGSAGSWPCARHRVSGSCQCSALSRQRAVGLCAPKAAMGAQR